MLFPNFEKHWNLKDFTLYSLPYQIVTCIVNNFRLVQVYHNETYVMRLCSINFATWYVKIILLLNGGGVTLEQNFDSGVLLDVWWRIKFWYSTMHVLKLFQICQQTNKFKTPKYSRHKVAFINSTEVAEPNGVFNGL